MNKAANLHLFSKTPEQIVAEAREQNPVKWLVGYSGGDDSAAAVAWAMENVPGCEVLHINTGIGIERTRQHVRDVCAMFGWVLHEIRAKEDCGQDYRQMVIEHGFPGPYMHRKMYQRLKERCVRKVIARFKNHRRQRVAIITGIRYEESAKRMLYAGGEVNRVGSQLWVNPLYWWTKQQMMVYARSRGVPRSPVSAELGMSGECLCGAYAHPGELALIKIVCPQTHAYIRELETEVRAAGHAWGWEDKPPRKLALKPISDERQTTFMPLCVGCEKMHGEEAS